MNTSGTGTANIFVAVEFKAGKRVTQVTKRRNDQEKKIDWRFTKEKADKKLSKYYV